jgi:hypothetical protein
LDDLCIDTPNARKIVAEYAARASDFGYLRADDAKALSASDSLLHSGDEKALAGIKAAFKDIVAEYLSGADQDEAVRRLTSDVKSPAAAAFHFEFVKILISKALDANDSARELASRLVARVSGDVMPQSAVVRAFEVLLQRVEDLFLDVPSILHLLSAFLARAVVDEAIPPAFLSRADLAVSDMGYRVVKEAAELCKGVGAAKRLLRVWKSAPSAAAAAPVADKKPVAGGGDAKAASPSAAASASASSSPTGTAIVTATGTTGTATVVESGKKKAILSLKPAVPPAAAAKK